MTIYMLHNRVSSGRFDAAEEYVQFADIQQASQYYKQNLEAPLALRMANRRQSIVPSIPTTHSRHADIAALAALSTPTDILSARVSSAFDAALLAPQGAHGAIASPMLLAWPNLLSNHFYEHVKYKGRKFTLSNYSKTVVYDANLVDNGFNDVVSSIDTGKLVIVVLCAEHINFGGEWLICFVDKPDLTKHRRSNGQSWNDCISSVACATVSLTDLLSVLALVFGV